MMVFVPIQTAQLQEIIMSVCESNLSCAVNTLVKEMPCTETVPSTNYVKEKHM